MDAQKCFQLKQKKILLLRKRKKNLIKNRPKGKNFEKHATKSCREEFFLFHLLPQNFLFFSKASTFLLGINKNKINKSYEQNQVQVIKLAY